MNYKDFSVMPFKKFYSTRYNNFYLYLFPRERTWKLRDMTSDKRNVEQGKFWHHAKVIELKND